MKCSIKKRELPPLPKVTTKQVHNNHIYGYGRHTYEYNESAPALDLQIPPTRSDSYMAVRFCFGSPSTDKKYKVIKIAEHERNHRPLAYIEEIDGLSYNRCYLIEVKGLEKA